MNGPPGYSGYPPAYGGYPQPPQPAPQGSAAKGRVLLVIIALGCGFCLFQCGREAIRPHDGAPVPATLDDAARMSEGRWVRVEGMVDVGTVYGTEGVLLRGENYAFQLEGDTPGIVVVTNARRTPSLKDVRAKDDKGGWLVRGMKRAAHDGGADESDTETDAAAADTPKFLTTRQTFTGMLYRPGGQFMQKDDVVELDDEKLDAKSYCRQKGVRCTDPPLLLLSGMKPTPRVLPIAGALLALLAMLFFFVVALSPRRAAPAPPMR